MTVKILEIDDNNSSNVFTNSSSVDSMSVTVRDGEKAFTEMLFEQMANGTKLLLDLGGGNDSKAGLGYIRDSGLEFTYVIPVGNSLAQLQNALDTYNMIGDPKNTIFAINQVHDIKNIKEEFLFWFGSEEYGIEPFCEKVSKSKTIFIPFSPLFEIAAMNGLTVADLAEFSKGIPKDKSISILYKESGGDKATFTKLSQQYKQSIRAAEYLDAFVTPIKEVFKNTKNIAVVSTKGGVGKSTISWHLLNVALKG